MTALKGAVFFLFKKYMGYTAQPSPTPTGKYQQQAVVPQPAPAPISQVLGASTNGTGNADEMWNQGWNTGFNSGGSSNTNNDPNFSSGYNAGWAEYQKRNSSNTKTSVNNTSSTNSNTPSVEDQARSQYFSFLDNQLGELPGLQSNLESQIINSYGSNKSTIDTNLNNTLTDLETSKTNITDNKISSIRDLDKYMINQLKAGDTYLGNRGATDSSANNQLQYALGRVGTQGRADISKQANQLYAQVDTQMTKAKTLAQDEVQKLDTWKNNQLLEVSKYIQSLRGNIDQAKATYIQSYLANIDNQVNNYKQTVSNWIVNKADSLGQVVSQLQQYGIAPNTGISDPSMPTLGQGASTDNTNYLYGVAKKDQNLGY